MPVAREARFRCVVLRCRLIPRESSDQCVRAEVTGGLKHGVYAETASMSRFSDDMWRFAMVLGLHQAFAGPQGVVGEPIHPPDGVDAADRGLDRRAVAALGKLRERLLPVPVIGRVHVLGVAAERGPRDERIQGRVRAGLADPGDRLDDAGRKFQRGDALVAGRHGPLAARELHSGRDLARVHEESLHVVERVQRPSEASAFRGRAERAAERGEEGLMTSRA